MEENCRQSKTFSSANVLLAPIIVASYRDWPTIIMVKTCSKLLVSRFSHFVRPLPLPHCQSHEPQLGLPTCDPGLEETAESVGCYIDKENCSYQASWSLRKIQFTRKAEANDKQGLLWNFKPKTIVRIQGQMFVARVG
jgi:hypothetical protein